MDYFQYFYLHMYELLRHSSQKVYCVNVTVCKAKFHVEVLVKNVFVSYMSWPKTCRVFQTNNTFETPCSGSFPHGFPTYFSWGLYALLTDSVIVLTLAVG